MCVCKRSLCSEVTPLQVYLKPSAAVPSIMALHLHTYFAGALDLWVQDEIDADGFRSHMRCAAAMALLPLAEAAQRQALQAHVDAFVPTAQAYESAAARTVSAI